MRVSAEQLARGLARGSTNSIAVLVSLGLSMVDVAEIQGIHDAALSMDYDILIHDVTNKPLQSSVARVIGGQRGDALLGLHLYDITDDEVATISESEILSCSWELRGMTPARSDGRRLGCVYGYEAPARSRLSTDRFD